VADKDFIVKNGLVVSNGNITVTGTVDGRDISVDGTKLDGIASGANNYTLPAATSTVRGGVELFSDTVQSVAATAVSATASRTYGLQVNAAGQAVVNVPWTDTNSGGTVTSVTGTAPIVSSGGNAPAISITAATTSAAGSMSAADKTKLDGLSNYSLPAATATVLGGVELFSDTVQSVAANAVTATASKTYGIQVNSVGQAVVNVPWTDTDTVYTHPTGGANTTISAGNGVVLSAITVNSLGHTTSVSSKTLAAADIPNLDASKITSGVIDAARLPSFVDDVLEYAALANFPATGETGKIYVALDTNKTYRWSGSAYVYITSGAVDSVGGNTGVVTATNLLDSIKTVDGASSGLDADLLDGQHASAFYLATNPNGYTSNTGTVTSVTGTAPIVSSGGNTPAISISAATTSAAGSMSSADKTKLDGIATNANNYTLPAATSTVRGGVELFSDTVQSVAANAVSATASRSYGIQVNSDGQAVVNVPWTDTNSGGTVTSVTGTAPIVSSGGTTPAISISAATTSAAGSMSAADKTKLDGIATSANNYTLPAATSTALGGIELFSDTVQSVAANAVSATASRTYGIQVNAAGQAVVNVPWVDTDTNTTYSAGTGLTLTTTTFSVNYGTTSTTACVGNDSRLSDARQATNTNTQLASLGVGTAASGTAGEIRATNNVTAYYSDDRLKTKLGLIDNALEKVLSLSGFYYEANSTAQALGYEVKQEVGVSAQEVQAVMPEVVAPAPIDDRYLTVRYERLVPLLIEAIKEQQQQINKLKAKLGE
jgi:hypothetical protein